MRAAHDHFDPARDLLVGAFDDDLIVESAPTSWPSGRLYTAHAVSACQTGAGPMPRPGWRKKSLFTTASTTWGEVLYNGERHDTEDIDSTPMGPAHLRVKNLIEGADTDINLLIGDVWESGQISRRLKAEFPLLAGNDMPLSRRRCAWPLRTDSTHDRR